MGKFIKKEYFDEKYHLLDKCIQDYGGVFEEERVKKIILQIFRDGAIEMQWRIRDAVYPLPLTSMGNAIYHNIESAEIPDVEK